MTDPIHTSSYTSIFEEMEEEVLRMESESEAMSGQFYDDDLEKKFAELNGGSVEDELNKLKQKINHNSKKKY